MQHEKALTPRQVEVLRLVAEGYHDKLIASRLGISMRCVARHVASARGRLGARSRAQAVAIATRTDALAATTLEPYS